tara:strand:- start:1975 stop:3348 length:1374 start_codon:yes stop_codon:yes gene_type:complete
MDFSQTSPYDTLLEKWEPLINHESIPSIQDSYKRKVTAVLLENQENALRQQYITEVSANNMGGNFSNAQVGSAGGLAGYDPILISLVRRSMPNLMAYDIAGVQPMSAPTGLIFAMRSKYDSQTGKEALFQESFAQFGGSGNTSTGAATMASQGVIPYGATAGAAGNVRGTTFAIGSFRGMLTSDGEALGGASKTFNEMAFSIERIAVEARTRALKAEYTTELAQDLKAVHGLDAESELANILSSEILNEINRELMYTLYRVAKTGAAQVDLTTAGIYDLNTDSDGRWSAERFRGLMFQIEREANQIAKETRRGKGNFVVCSSDVASALAMGGFLNVSPALNVQLEVDDTGNTFAGILNGKFKVYIDPYAATGINFCMVGYRGASPYDAGVFYCPYVPLQMVRAVDQNTFQPKIGFKTRYGMVANPFSENTSIDAVGQNQYYRIFRVDNLHGNTGYGS